jgi:phosphopantothenoylcysteine decarboxylase/phosphopantothenate--cysteine ligase
VVVTAGGTREPLDAVRFLGNRSSGKMGFALAEAARCEGAEVVLVSGPTWLEPPPGVSMRMVETAREMYDCVLAEAEDAEIIIKAAAVADFTPVRPQAGKVKKEQAELTLELERTPDILAELGARKRPGQILVGFSAETEQVRKNAQAKLRRKNLDLIVANDVSRSDAGFEVDSNQAVILAADDAEQELPLMSKADLARIVVERVVELRR